MAQYKVIFEAADEPEVLERNFYELMILIINNCASEVSENEKGNYLSQSIDGGAS